jgi:hypothetical protein
MAFSSGGASALAIGEPTKKSHILLYAVIGIVIIAIGVGVYLYLKSRKTTSSNTNHGTSGTSGLSGHSGTTGTTGTIGTTGPCSAPTITMNALTPPWFIFTSVTQTPTSFTLTFDTNGIPAGSSKMTLEADNIALIGPDPNNVNSQCGVTIPFPGPFIVTSPNFSITIPHQTSYAVMTNINVILGTVGCSVLNMPSCDSSFWTAVFVNAKLVNACGLFGPSESLDVTGGVCVGASSAFPLVSAPEFFAQ